jgi:hypothetical protein
VIQGTNSIAVAWHAAADDESTNALRTPSGAAPNATLRGADADEDGTSDECENGDGHQKEE